MTKSIDSDSGVRKHAGNRTVSRADAASPRWLKLGIVAALGTLAGTMLFATRAEGGAAKRERSRR